MALVYFGFGPGRGERRNADAPGRRSPGRTAEASHLLDEPSVGLAPNIAEELCATIAAINREQGLTILLVEQNAHAAMALCDYGNIIESGRIVLHGTAGILGTLPIMRPDDGPPRRLIPTNACAACSA